MPRRTLPGPWRGGFERCWGLFRVAGDRAVVSNKTPLTDLGFDALQQRHETLASHRNRCEGTACDRQAFLQAATNNVLNAGIRHRSLVPYLCQDSPADHPVLATVATLEETCQECQGPVRNHSGPEGLTQ